MKTTILFILAFFFVVTTRAQQVPSADEVLNDAYATATKENKKVFVIFHASWCGWCRKMDTSINDPSCKPFFDKNYVIVHLTVLESEKNKQLENPGAFEFLKKYGGEELGLPFWLIFDKDKNLLADAQMRPGANTGCPANEEEVEHLITVLKKTSSITNEEATAVKKRFRKNE